MAYLGADAGHSALALSREVIGGERLESASIGELGIDRDIELLKHINAERDTFLSIGALVASPGAVHIGDEVQHLPANK